ncbi:hypothetical protein BTE77_31430 [Ensifer adhaerens]|nr:hypothetical protein BTE77_31430 [Ensifer adhaerens]
MRAESTPSKREILADLNKQADLVPTDKPEPPPPVEDNPHEETARELAYAKLRAFQHHHDSKKAWSTFMIIVMAALIGFQMLLLAMVGFGWWDFTKYEWLLPVVLVQNFGQIVALAIIVVKALFDSFKE